MEKKICFNFSNWKVGGKKIVESGDGKIDSEYTMEESITSTSIQKYAIIGDVESKKKEKTLYE